MLICEASAVCKKAFLLVPTGSREIPELVSREEGPVKLPVPAHVFSGPPASVTHAHTFTQHSHCCVPGRIHPTSQGRRHPGNTEKRGGGPLGRARTGPSEPHAGSAVFGTSTWRPSSQWEPLLLLASHPHGGADPSPGTWVEHTRTSDHSQVQRAA